MDRQAPLFGIGMQQVEHDWCNDEEIKAADLQGKQQIRWWKMTVECPEQGLMTLNIKPH